MKSTAMRSDLRHIPALLALLLACNLSLFFGMPAAWLSFNNRALATGEWWRIVTHPFVHVSFYHLLIDGTAFLMLYSALAPMGRARRFAVVLASGAGSLAGAWLTIGQYGAHSFCGLSGIGHGLMAAYGLLLVLRGTDRATVHAGHLTLALVVVKSMVECISGDVVFSFLHIGSVGIPIPACHAGGVLGVLALHVRCHIFSRS